MELNENLISSELQVEQPVHAALTEAARWAKFIAIAGFIFSGLIIIGSAYYIVLLNNARSYVRAPLAASAMVGIFFYVVVAIVWIIISVMQYRFAVKMQQAIEGGHQELLNESFENLKLYYRIRGIVTIITLLLSVLGTCALLATLAEKM